MQWKIVTFMICVYGVVKEFRPATPFLTPFLVSEYKNLSVAEVYSEVYPFWTYSYLVALVPIFFLTDLLRYKPIIVLEAASLCATWVLLVAGEGVHMMQLMQICFGIASAAEIAFSSYLYAVVDSENYRTVTSYIRTSVLVGKLFAFALAQLIVSYDLGSYLLLNQISLGAVSFVMVIAILLPCVPKEHDRVASSSNTEEAVILKQTSAETPLTGGYIQNTVSHLKLYVRNPIVLKWSLWWALTSCAMFQVYNYVQPLWIEVDPSHRKSENGLVEFINTLLGATVSFAIQFVNVDWTKSGEWILGFSSVVLAIVVYLMSQTTSLYLAYLYYIIAVYTYHGMGTIASATIAGHLPKKTYGLIFGFNTLVALLLQSVLTFTIVDRNLLGLRIQEQFFVYSIIFTVTGVVFFLSTSHKQFYSRIGNSEITVTEETNTTV